MGGSATAVFHSRVIRLVRVSAYETQSYEGYEMIFLYLGGE